MPHCMWTACCDVCTEVVHMLLSSFSCRSGRVSELRLGVLVSGVGAERNFQTDEGEQSSGERYLPAADRGTAVYTQVPLYVYTCTKVNVEVVRRSLWLCSDCIDCFIKVDPVTGRDKCQLF